MANPPEITFYDIASGPPVRPFAPNPWKTRYALNFKRRHGGLQYQTRWVDLADVAEVRKGLGALPVRKHLHDDSDFYTLPVIVHHRRGQQEEEAEPVVVGDSFDIAVYLDKTYDGGPRLLPDGTAALHRAFNTLVDTVFTEHALLVLDMPFNPATEAAVKAEFCRRVGKQRWEELVLPAGGGARAALLARFEARLGELARLYARRDEGPFLEGAVPMYADMIVGGWLQWLRGACPEWDRIKTWHGGLWEKLDQGLSVYAQAT